jgi:hypothetical protein
MPPWMMPRSCCSPHVPDVSQLASVHEFPNPFLHVLHPMQAIPHKVKGEHSWPLVGKEVEG